MARMSLMLTKGNLSILTKSKMFLSKIIFIPFIFCFIKACLKFEFFFTYKSFGLLYRWNHFHLQPVFRCLMLHWKEKKQNITRPVLDRFHDSGRQIWEVSKLKVIAERESVLKVQNVWESVLKAEKVCQKFIKS